MHKSQAAKFCAMASNTVGISIAVLFVFCLFICKNVHQFTCTKQKTSDDMRFTGHSRIMGRQYRTSCCPSVARNLKMPSRFLDNLWTLGIKIKAM
jgi:hypothetical protein